MNEKDTKLTCSVCHAYLFEDDDVVYCPVCGAPHHRDCYNSLGHCAYLEAHGTDNEYKKPEYEENTPIKQTDFQKITCQICGAEYSGDENKCPKCSAPNFNMTGGFSQFDFLGGVSEDTDLGSGVTAAEARRFVFTNTRRYIPKFVSIKSGKKAGWNWFTFLFPSAWFLSRKMYAAGIITGILSICFSLFLLPFAQVLYTSSITSFSQLAEAVLSDSSTIKSSVIILAYIGSSLRILLHVLSAIFADKIYRDYAIETISEIKKTSDDIDYDYRKKGGTNFILLLLGFFAVQYIPQIIFSLIS